jgi:hypothetical protein
LVGMRSSAVRSVHPTSRQRLRKIDGDETFTRERICRDTNTVYELQGCSKQLIVQDGGQYLVLCHGDQAITCPFSILCLGSRL